MGRLRSDVRAVTAIVVGAAAGVAGTVMTLGALDGASVEAEACVERDASVVVYTVKGTPASVVVGSRAPRPAVACERAGQARTFTILGAPERDEVRIRLQATPRRLRGEALRLQGEALRARGEALRLQGEEMRGRSEEVRQRVEEVRQRAEEVRQRAEEMRQRAEEMRARSEEARVRVERLRSDRSGVGGGSGG